MKKPNYLFVMLLLVAGIFWGAARVEAAPRPLTDLGYFHWANQSVTPAENTFIMHYGENTTVEPLEGDVYSDYLTVDRKTDKSKALVRNVGFYEGKEVSLLVTLERNKSNLDGGSISLTKSYFLGITVKGEMIVTYDFVDDTGQPLAIKTSFNYYGLNSNKYIGYKNPGTVIDSLYAENPTHILYDTWDGGGDDYWLYLKNITAGIPWRDPRQRFEITTKAVSNVMFVVHNNDVTPSSIVYFTDFLAKPEFSPAYAVDSSFENANRDVCLKAKQTIPNVDQWQKSTQMAINVNMEQVNRTQQYTFDKVIVTNFNGEDLTDLFSSQADDKNVQIVAKNPSDSRLYDTILQYKVCLKWIGAKNPVDTAIVSDGKLHLPFKVETILDGDHLEENAASSIVNYLGKETTAFLNEQDTLLHDSITKAGILTTSFDLSDDYPEIPGYEPIKDEKQDKGIFLPEEQTIIHRYREKKKLQFELTDMENPLFISRFTNKRELAFAFTHDKTTNISLMAQCGAEVKELKKYTDAPESVVDRLVFEFPENWLDQEVSFYIKDDNNQESEKESRFIKKESSPKLIIPDTISFGENEIPAMDRVISATTKEEFGVEDKSKLDKSHWKIKVKEEQPLTNEKGQVLAQRLSYKNQKQEVPINGDNQPILEGSGSTKVNLAAHLQLAVHPSDTVGSYNGVLCWSLEDVPE
jgi:hypothetical protein